VAVKNKMRCRKSAICGINTCAPKTLIRQKSRAEATEPGGLLGRWVVKRWQVKNGRGRKKAENFAKCGGSGKARVEMSQE